MSDRFWSANTTVHISTSVNDPNVRNPEDGDDTLNQMLYPDGFPYHVLTGRLSTFFTEKFTPKQLYKKLHEKEMEKAQRKAKKLLQKSGNNFDSDNEAGGNGAAGMGGSSGNPPGGSGSGVSGGAGGRGATSGKSRFTRTNPFDVLGEEGPTGSLGYAAYYGEVMVKGKASTTLVSVVPAGMSDGKGGVFFCWHFGDKQTSCFTIPPDVSEKDPRQARAARLYDLAVKLYKGKLAPLVPQEQYELPIRGAASDSNYTYARPDSRDGADSYGAYAPRPHSRGDPHPGNATPPPSSKPVAPPPPRNVRPEKSRDKYTVHGIDKGTPYFKGIDKKDPGRHVDVQYSQTEKQYYVKPGSERIWLKEVR